MDPGPETCRAMQIAISIIDLELASLALYPEGGIHGNSGPKFETYRAKRVQVRAAREALSRSTPSSVRGAICMLLAVFHDAGCAPASVEAAVRRDAVLGRLEELRYFVSAEADERQNQPWIEVFSALIELFEGGELELAPTLQSHAYVWRRAWSPLNCYLKVARSEPAWRRFEASLVKGATSLLSYREWIGPWSLDVPDPQSPEPTKPPYPEVKMGMVRSA